MHGEPSAEAQVVAAVREGCADREKIMPRIAGKNIIQWLIINRQTTRRPDAEGTASRRKRRNLSRIAIRNFDYQLKVIIIYNQKYRYSKGSAAAGEARHDPDRSARQ
ncbi:hypothetical protein P7L75_13635 [Tistrella mobilis]|uniref:hypothetical protein n=1 Tax=Tistrella mobilis TaxID=171437 RepID=UPI003557B955